VSEAPDLDALIARARDARRAWFDAQTQYLFDGGHASAERVDVTRRTAETAFAAAQAELSRRCEVVR
jgi:hypothetical protein